MLFEWLSIGQGEKTLDGVGYDDGYSFTRGVVGVEGRSSRLPLDPRIRVRQLGRDIFVEGPDVGKAK